MAISFVNATTGTRDDGGAITVPVPAGVQDGDLLLTFISARPTGYATWTPPAGWGPLQPEIAVSSSVSAYCYGRWASSEPASYDWASDDAGGLVAVCVAYRGVAAIEAAGQVQYGLASASSIQGTSNNAWYAGSWFVCAYIKQYGNATFTADASQTERAEITNTNASYYRGAMVSDEALAATGDPGSRTCTLSASSSRRAAVAVILIPTMANLIGKTLFRQSTVAADDGYFRPNSLFDQFYFGKMTADVTAFARFPNVTIPSRATILSAYLLTAATAPNTNDVDVVARYVDQDNPAAPATYAQAAAMPQSATGVTWNNVESYATGQGYRSLDLAALIQEIVDRPGWASGNALIVLLVSSASTGSRQCARDEAYATAPVLIVNYTSGNPQRRLRGVGT